jgi:opacity protein-like surface antigen
MKRSLVVASFLMLCSSASFADSNPWFVGGEFGGMNMKYKFEGTDGVDTLNLSDTVNATYESLKVGKYFEYGRVYTSIVRQNKKDDFSSWSAGLGYDYLFRNSTSVTPFIGINGLYTKGKDETNFAKSYDIDNPKGFSYGAEAGLIYAVSTNIDLEIGTRYMDSSNVDDSRTEGAAHGKFEGKHTLQYYFGANYKF